MKGIKIAFLLVTICAAKGQTHFVVKASDTQEGLIGATAVVENSKGEMEKLVSDTNGLFRSSLSLPLQVKVRYQGFDQTNASIKQTGQTILMQPSETTLDEVVVTGQYEPQSARNSLYKVRTISADRIASQNANTIHDILSNELNIQISRDNATGRSSLSMQGLSGQYVKVLIDGIPMVGKGGVQNDIDLAQIDVQNIERIEIVEGPMAVNYGADALAGVINIVTKKDVKKNMELAVNLQTETVGNEYRLFDEGIYSPSVSFGYKLSDKWYTQINSRMYRFGGWQGLAEGREREWHPKDQLFGGWLTRYQSENWEIFYRLDVMDEKIVNLGPVRTLDNKEPRATDEEYNAVRFMHQLQSDLSIGKATLNTSLAFTDYERLSTNYERFLDSDTERPLQAGNDTVYYQTFFSRNTLNNLFSNDHRGFQIGIETTHETAGGSTLSAGDKQLTDIAMFMSAEFRLNQLKIRPGIRYSYNSLFETIPTPSINFSYQPGKSTQLRWSYGRGFRSPSIRELFHEFIDSNHNLIGNPDLEPENSHNFNIDITHQLQVLPVSLSMNAFYNEINNGITIFVPDGNQATTYFNLSEFKSLGANFRSSFEKNAFNATLGFSYIGRYQALSNEPDVPDFIYAAELVARTQYRLDPVGISLSAFYKFNGPIKQYQLVENTPQLVGQDGFHTLDININKALGRALRAGLGVRNIFDVTRINATGGGSGAHGGGNGTAPVGFGRSYFLTLNYKLIQ